MTELRHEIATLLSEELPWPEASALASRVLKLVAKPEVYPEHEFRLRCREIWPKIPPAEITILRLLLSKEMVRFNEILYAIGTKSEETLIMRVRITQLRKTTGAEIKSVYGIGYSMPLADREKLKRKIGDLK